MSIRKSDSSILVAAPLGKTLAVEALKQTFAALFLITYLMFCLIRSNSFIKLLFIITLLQTEVLKL